MTTFAVFPLIDQCTQPKINDIKRRERVFEDIIGDIWSLLNLHHMRYECIALSLGCSGSAMTPLGLDSCLSAAFPGVVTFSLPMSHTRITSMYSHIIFLRHCDEEILAAEHKKLSPPGLLMTINCKNPPLVYQNWPWKHRGQRCSQSPPQLPSLPLITKIKYRILNVFTFPSHPFSFPLQAWTTVLGPWSVAWRTSKASAR